MRSLLLLAGILAALWMPPAWQATLSPWWLLVAIPLLVVRRSRPLLIAVIGLVYALHVTRVVTQLPPVAAGTRLIVEALVDSVPAFDDSGWQFDARIHFVRHVDWRPQRWRVRLPASMQAPAPGERWQLALRFDPPRDATERRLLLRDRISAQARMVDGAMNQRLASGSAGFDGLRERVARRIADRVADPSAAALLAALAVGVTGEVSARQWQVFNATGITHLVAISGMHVTFFAMLSMAAARRVWPLFTRWRRVPRRESFTAAVGIGMALLYALLSGFSVPAQRTVLMLTAFLLARECARCSPPAWSVTVALTAVLLFDPLAALSAGFWLSFLAVAAIVLLAGAHLIPGAPLRDAVRLQWLVSIALLPATVIIFGSFSAVGLLANALAIPVFTFLLVPPILVATACHLIPLDAAAWCGDHLVDLAATVARALWPFLAWCAGLPGALWRSGAPASWFALAIPAALLALMPVPTRWRVAAMLLLLSPFVLREPRPSEGELWIDVPDAGRSSAVMLRTPEHLLLWGTGESFGSQGRAFTRHLQPLLQSGAHTAIDLWLPGNLTRDAQQAMMRAAAHWPVLQTLLPPARAAPPEMAACSHMAWTWNRIAFEVTPAEDGRACLLTAATAGHVMRWGGKQATALPDSRDAVVRLVLDAGGLHRRHSHLRL